MQKKLILSLLGLLFLFNESFAQLNYQNRQYLQHLFLEIPVNANKKEVTQHLSRQSINFQKGSDLISGVFSHNSSKHQAEIHYSFTFNGPHTEHRFLRIIEDKWKAIERFREIKDKVGKMSKRTQEVDVENKLCFYNSSSDKEPYLIVEMKTLQENDTIQNAQKMMITLRLYENYIHI